MSGWLSTFADTIENICMQGNESDFIDRATLLWNILHSVIIDYQRRYQGWMFVKHEDISVRPDLGFQKIFEYLGLGMSPRTLSLVSRRLGWPGLMVSAGLWGYDKWKNRSINDED